MCMLALRWEAVFVGLWDRVYSSGVTSLGARDGRCSTLAPLVDCVCGFGFRRWGSGRWAVGSYQFLVCPAWVRPLRLPDAGEVRRLTPGAVSRVVVI